MLKDDYQGVAKEVMEKLGKYKIGTRPFFYPMHKQPVFMKKGFFVNKSLPISEKLYKKGFYIPSGLALTKEQIEEVSDKIGKVVL